MLNAIQRGPDGTGIKDFDLTGAPGAKETGNIIDFGPDFLIEIHVKVSVGASGAVGTAKLALQRVDEAGNNLGDPVDLMTGIITSDNTEAVVSMGSQGAEAVNGTVGASADSWRVFSNAKLILEVEVSSDATTPLGSVTVTTKR